MCVLKDHFIFLYATLLISLFFFPATIFAQAPYDLGTLPEEFDELQWPTAPTITDEVTVSNVSELTDALGQNNMRIIVEAGTYVTQLSIGGSDKELIFEEGAIIAPSGSTAFSINNAQRISIVGGDFEGGVYIFGSSGDILLDDVNIDTKRAASQWEDTVEIAPSSNGNRIAIINSSISAYRYAGFVSGVTDFILANTNLHADGPESTLRLMTVVRAVIVDNRLYNGMKHTFRAHDSSDLVFFARNQVEYTGFMFNNIEPDPNVIRAWLYDNTFYHQTNSLMQTGNTEETLWLTAVNNTAYTTSCADPEGCGETITAHGAWGPVSNNLRFPYQEPPEWGSGEEPGDPDPDTTPPTTPTNLSATAESQTVIDLAWTASTDEVGVTGYQVESCVGTDCSAFAQIATSTLTSYSHTDLNEDTTYRYRVRAFDEAGNFSGYSSIASATTEVAPEDPEESGNGDPEEEDEVTVPSNVTTTSSGGSTRGNATRQAYNLSETDQRQQATELTNDFNQLFARAGAAIAIPSPSDSDPEQRQAIIQELLEVIRQLLQYLSYLIELLNSEGRL